MAEIYSRTNSRLGLASLQHRRRGGSLHEDDSKSNGDESRKAHDSSMDESEIKTR